MVATALGMESFRMAQVRPRSSFFALKGRKARWYSGWRA
jgi:hypothetical protein